MFTILFDKELERRGYKTVQQKADACGIEYEVMRQMLKGKHPSDERIAEIGARLKLGQQIIAELLLAKAKDRAKEEPAKQAWGYLSQLFEDAASLKLSQEKFKNAYPALRPDSNLTDDEKTLVTLYRQLCSDDKAEIRGEIRGMLKAEKYRDDPGDDLEKLG